MEGEFLCAAKLAELIPLVAAASVVIPPDVDSLIGSITCWFFVLNFFFTLFV